VRSPPSLAHRLRARCRRALSRPGVRFGLWLLLGLSGFAANGLPLEIFPGIHLILGNAVAIWAASRWGPVAGATVGLTAGLRTWSLWHQPLPWSALLYGLEGLWVGHAARRRGSGPLVSTLSYWLFAGSWLNLIGQIAVIGLPLRLALIIQARSVVNGLLVGALVETSLLLATGLSAGRARRGASHPRPDLQTVVTLALTIMSSVPILFVSIRGAQRMLDTTLGDLVAQTERDVAAVEAHVRTLVESYQRGIETAATLISPETLADRPALQRLLAAVRRHYPEFAGMYVADAHATTLAFDPEKGDGGGSLVGLSFRDRPYYQVLLDTRAPVVSGVYQARGGMSGPAVAIGAPVLAADGTLLAFVLGWFDVNASFPSVLSRFESRDETVVIADRGGLLVADSSLAVVRYSTVVDLSESPEAAIAGGGGHGSSFFRRDHPPSRSPALTELADRVLLTYATEPATGWKIWSRRSLAPAKAVLDRWYLSHLLVLVAGLLIAFVLSRGVAGLLVRPIAELRRGAERLAAGDLSQRPRPVFLVAEELSSLFESFRAMAANLEASWHRQEELLREVSITKGELEATFDAMTDAVAITDSSGRLRRANRSYFALWRLDPASAVGMPLNRIEHPAGAGPDCKLCELRAGGGQGTFSLLPRETVLGRHLEVRIDPLKTEGGEPGGAVQVIRDLSDIRRAQAEVESSDALLRNLIEAASDAVFAIDLGGLILWANQRTASLFGVDPSQLRGLPLLGLLHAEDRGRIAEVLEQVALGGAQNWQARTAAESGERYLAVAASPVWIAGEVTSVLGIARDMTEERVSEERSRRAEKLRALGQLAAGVAHNFNNALTAVIGYTQLAQTKSADPEICGYLDTVHKSAVDAAKIVARIQNFARERHEEPRSCEALEQLLADALTLTRSRWLADAQARGIAYEVGISCPSDLTLWCDRSAIEEVLVNLIINALDAMPRGGRLAIGAQALDGRARISVADTGCGMPEAVRERLFEPFFTTKGVQGLGMGLAVSYSLIEQHGGLIYVASEAGKGTTFTVELPLSLPAFPADAREVPVVDQPATGPRVASILVVDDEAAVRRLLVSALRVRGHDVESAADGAEALQKLDARTFHLVITDLSMPGTDGLALAREVRRRSASTRVIIVSGYGSLSRDVFRGSFDEGAVDAELAKPFQIATVQQVVEQVLAGRPATE
jgi:PAS domain S-box-containing protein